MNRQDNPFDRLARQKWSEHIQALNPQIDPRATRLMEALRLVSHALHQVNENSLESAGLSYAKWRVLVNLHYADFHGEGALNPSDISERQGTSRNTISGLIRDLEEEGLVQRQLDPADRRRFEISLTETGRSLVETHARQHLNTINDCFSALTPAEQETLTVLLERVGLSVAALQGDFNSCK